MPTFRHGKNFTVLIDTYDLSTMFKSATMNRTVDMAETTAFQSTVKTWVPGIPNGTMDLQGMFSGAAGEVDAVLSGVLGAAGPYVVSIGPDGSMDEARRIYTGNAHAATYGVQGSVSDMVSVTANFQATGGFQSGLSLSDPTTARTATFNGTAVDYDASDTVGGFGVLQVISNTLDNSAVVKIQTATTSGGSYSDLITFTTVGTGATAAELVSVAAGTTKNQFVRVQLTTSGTGSIYLFAAYCKNPG